MKVDLTRAEIWILINALNKEAQKDAADPEIKKLYFKLSGQVTDNA